jgi:hypothetical protein
MERGTTGKLKIRLRRSDREEVAGNKAARVGFRMRGEGERPLPAEAP